MANEGWDRSWHRRKPHYFRGGVALCGRWSGPLTGLVPDATPDPEHCARCRAALDRLTTQP